MGLTGRQIDILEKVVEEYVRRARPVPSRLLSQDSDFSVCPATIRNEMCELVEKKYLRKPHASAGRIPTDRAYRFFVNRLEWRRTRPEDSPRLPFRKKSRDFWRQMGEVTDLLVEMSSLFALVGFPEKGLFFEGGWDEVLLMPEFEEREKTLGFARLIKRFKEDILSSSGGERKIQVYIGSENPWEEEGFEEFSIILTRCRTKKAERGVLSVMGPKRMAYEENISLLRSIKKAIRRLSR